MNLWDRIIKSLDLILHTNPRILRTQIGGAYCGDLLSDVLAHASPGDLWITIHRHRNVIAVATLVSISGVVITGSRIPDPDTIKDAEREGIPMFTTPLNNFQASGRIYRILYDHSLLKEYSS
ncbi:MAG: DRTGG domain-containing protein [Bacillota bacterium]